MQRSFTRLFGFIALLVALFALPSAASAANSCDVGTVDKTWVGNTSSDWFTDTNWSPSGVPGTAAPDVCVPASNPSPNPAPVIGTGATASAASIESFEPIEVNAGTLRVNSSRPAVPPARGPRPRGGHHARQPRLAHDPGEPRLELRDDHQRGRGGTVTIASAGTTTATDP